MWKFFRRVFCDRRFGAAIAAAALLLSVGLPATAAGVPAVLKQSGQCSALAPRDWSLTVNPQFSTAELQSGDGRMYAGWGVTAVDRSMQRYYGPLYGDPQTSILALTSLIARGRFADPTPPRFLTPPQPFLNYFVAQRVGSARVRGTVFYRIYPMAPQKYVESVYFALSDSTLPEAQRAVPAGVVVTIRCTTQIVSRPGGASGRSSAGGKQTRAGCGGEGNLRGYNKELGTQWAHTSSGTNYLFDIGDWRDNGPDGPGYYAKVGNREEKLELGRDDDC